MTNQEYLAERIQKLSAEEVYDLLYDILINESSRYNSSRAGIAQWLTEESKEHNDSHHGHWIDADKLEKDGWYMQRIRQSSETGVYVSETKKPTDFPAADVAEVRHGRWDNGFCSVCGEEALTEWNDTGGEYAFTTCCPNCGAKMERSKE